MADDYAQLVATPVPERRGATAQVMGGWHYLLVDADPDAALDALLNGGVIGAARRDCAAAVHAGKVPRPVGAWGALVRLRGQRWTYVLGDGLRKEWARDWAAAHGWRTALFTVGDLPASTTAAVYRGGEVEAELLCGFFKELPEGFTIERKLGDDRATIRGSVEIATQAWLDDLPDEAAALDRFARWADAYLPVALFHGDEEGVAEIWGRDGDPYAGDTDGPTADFEPADFARIDVFTFGDAATLEPAGAQLALGAAVRAGDSDAVRAALADGADPDLMPDDDETPLHEVIYLHEELGRDRQLAVIAALLDGGASTEPAGRDPMLVVSCGRRRSMGHDMDDAWHVALLRRLLAAGADPNAAPEQIFLHGGRPLFTAAEAGWLPVVKLLVAAGADVSAADHAGRTARQRVAEQRATLEERAGRKIEVPADATTLQKLTADMLRTHGQDAATEAALLAAVEASLADAERGAADTSDIDALADAQAAAKRGHDAGREGRNATRVATLAAAMDAISAEVEDDEA